MITQKHIKLLNKKVILLLLFSFFLNNSNSVEFNNSNQITNNFTETSSFYQFVISEYIWLIKKVYEGDAPFIVIVDDLFADQRNDNIYIKLTYTIRFKELNKYIGSHYYRYKEDELIYVVVNRIQGDTSFKSYFSNHYNVGKVTDTTLTKIFYPITFDLILDSLVKSQNKDELYHTKDIFQITKNQNRISSKINGSEVVYFRNYYTE
jgi:hypothetical protein